MLQASSAIISPVQGAVLGTADRQVKSGISCVLGQQSPRLEGLAEGGTHTGETIGMGFLSLLFLWRSSPTPVWRMEPARDHEWLGSQIQQSRLGLFSSPCQVSHGGL